MAVSFISQLRALHGNRDRLATLLLALASLACLLGWLDTSLALLAGIALSLSLGNPLASFSTCAAGAVLKTAVVGLGFGLPLATVLATARDSLSITVVTIALALVAGYGLAKLLRVERVLGQLLTAGTAICGGSAIAALAPVLRAKSESITIAVAVVFLLNALGLWLFPLLGHWLELSQAQFGLWAALAIHDTSSVVGAAASFGDEALAVATTGKLARAIWIVPLVLGFGIVYRQRDGKSAFPLFISLFLIASLLRTVFPALANWAEPINTAARALFALSLLWLGAGLSRATLQSISFRPLLFAVLLWLLLAGFSLFAIEVMT
ncbi:MAG: YeiH family protein [Pseudomonadota bacterium]